MRVASDNGDSSANEGETQMNSEQKPIASSQGFSKQNLVAMSSNQESPEASAKALNSPEDNNITVTVPTGNLKRPP